MAEFLTLQSNDGPVIVNLDRVALIAPSKQITGGSVLLLAGVPEKACTCTVPLSFEALKRAILGNPH